MSALDVEAGLPDTSDVTTAANPKFSSLVTLADALAAIRHAAQLCAPMDLAVRDAAGGVLAEEIAAPGDVPPDMIAARNGWAVSAAETMGASAYSPVPLPVPPFIPSGDSLPQGTDAVLRYDAVTVLGGFAEATEEAAPGEGVFAAGADVAKEHILAVAGDRLTPLKASALLASGITHLRIRRPRILILALDRDGASGLDASSPLIAACCTGAQITVRTTARGLHSISDALSEAAADAVIVIGGAGEGENDAALAALAAAGTVRFHGVALSPGENAGFGTVAEIPVLALPGRTDAALGAFLVLGQALLAALTGASTPPAAPIALPLTRKLVSVPGMTTLRFVRCRDEACEPLPHPLPLGRLGEIDGYVVSEAGGEGWPEGTLVRVHPLPRLW